LERMAEHVRNKFSLALKQRIGDTCDKCDSFPEIKAFCVAVAYRRCGQPGEPITSFVALSKRFGEAMAWSLAHGTGLGIAPPACNLKIPSRLIGHWRRVSAVSPLVFPITRRRLRLGFDEALDACAADLARLVEALPADLLEWASSFTSCRREAEHARTCLLTLSPPLEEWLKIAEFGELQETAQQYLEDKLGGLTVPCPLWWHESAGPGSDEEASRSVVRTSTIGRNFQPAQQSTSRPETSPLQDSPINGVRASVPEPSVAPAQGDTDSNTALVASSGADDVKHGESTIVLPSISGMLSQDAERTASLLQRVSSRPAVEAPRSKFDDFPGAPAMKRSKSSSYSVLEMLRKDAEWTEGLLRGVALLAAKTPWGV